MSTENLVFVYGTLKKGFGNHRVMEQAGGELIGPATTANKFSMYSLGGFPGVWLDIPTSQIYGELYNVQTMEPLDLLEGFPRFYTRVITLLTFPDGTDDAGWMYVLNPQTNEKPADDKLIPSGIWE